jgi:serine/threonine-protein kinase
LTAAVQHGAPPPARGQLDIGNVIDNRYRIERLIGRGGMGTVYLAHDEVLDERVALKVISSLIADDPGAMIARFRREAAAARRISSPNVVRIHDIGEADGGLVYISMEYLVGQTLAKIVETRHPMPIDGVLGLVDQVCTGLAAAHQGGVIHRDLKPGNVLVGDRDAVKIIDFGLAKSGFLDGMTVTGMMLGTPAYMAPEQVKGLEVDERTDIYALGALTYFVVTGRPPFSGATPIAIGFAHCATPPRPPRELRPDLPPALEAAILAALEKEPEKRPKSVDAFRAALRAS